jgi:excisionase family DNA binding protein
MNTDFITLEEFCQMTGYKKNTVYTYLRRKDKGIPAYHFGRLIRFKRSEVIEYINTTTKKIEYAA